PKSAWQSDLASRLHELQEAALAGVRGADRRGRLATGVAGVHRASPGDSGWRPFFDLASSRTGALAARLAFQFRVQDLRSRTALPVVTTAAGLMGAADPTGFVGRGARSTLG
uniref:Type VI secretion system membrane subunit TssM n=1 Tax=Macrostomum lignano TaxID=282301 RepID=A0A1I8FCH2_9PLAT